MRIVSIAPGATEIICAIGAGDELVGRSHECDWPVEVRALPVCTRAAFDTNVSSREIDAEVNRRLRAGEPLYYIDMRLIAELKPDVLIAQSHCAVCAPTPDDLEKGGCNVIGGRVVPVSANSLSGIYSDIAVIGDALGRTEAARQLIAKMQFEFDSIRGATRDRRHPSVLVLEWTDPPFAMGNWGPELVEIAGGELLLGRRGEHSQAFDWQEVLRADPEVLIIAPCGFDLQRSCNELATLEAYRGWDNLRAVREGKVFFADGNRYFNRSGVTVVDSARLVAKILHGVGDRDFTDACRKLSSFAPHVAAF